MRSFGAQENLKGARHGTLGRCLALLFLRTRQNCARSFTDGPRILANRNAVPMQVQHFFVSKKRC